MAYTPILWKNKEESAVTPLNAENLNHMDSMIAGLDAQVTNINERIVNMPLPSAVVKNWTINPSTGLIRVEWADGRIQNYDLNLEKIPVNFSMSPDGVITMETADGTKYTADLKQYIKPYRFNNSDTIGVVENGNNVTFNVLKGSITDEYIEGQYLAKCVIAKEQAEGYADTCATKARAAADSAMEAEGHKDEAHENSLRALDYCERAENSATYIDEAIANETPHFELNFETGHLEYTGVHFIFNVNDDGHFIWSVA